MGAAWNCRSYGFCGLILAAPIRSMACPSLQAVEQLIVDRLPLLPCSSTVRRNKRSTEPFCSCGQGIGALWHIRERVNRVFLQKTSDLSHPQKLLSECRISCPVKANSKISLSLFHPFWWLCEPQNHLEEHKNCRFFHDRSSYDGWHAHWLYSVCRLSGNDMWFFGLSIKSPKWSGIWFIELLSGGGTPGSIWSSSCHMIDLVMRLSISSHITSVRAWLPTILGFLELFYCLPTCHLTMAIRTSVLDLVGSAEGWYWYDDDLTRWIWGAWIQVFVLGWKYSLDPSLSWVFEVSYEMMSFGNVLYVTKPTSSVGRSSSTNRIWV